MTLLSSPKTRYAIKRQTSLYSTKTLIWLIITNIIILVLATAYHFWNTYQIIEQEGKAQVQEAALNLQQEISKIEPSGRQDVLPSSLEQTDIHTLLQVSINNLNLSTKSLSAGYYDSASDTYFTEPAGTKALLELESGSATWQDNQNGHVTWIKTKSANSWTKDSLIYISPITRNDLVAGYIWLSLEYPSIQFFAGQALFSNIIFVILTTLLISLIWLLFVRKVNHTLILSAEQEYQAIERFHWMSEMSAAISHEIRNPLTTVRGFLQLFQTKSHLPAKDKEIIQLMISELDHSTILIKDFLDVTKPETKETVEINLKDTLTKLIRVIDALALGHNVQISLELPYCDTYIKANLQAFRQVIINLMQNAIQAMPKGGEISVNVMRNDAEILIEIRDNGVGMDQETLQNLGKPFFTTKKSGTGLGIPMCLHLVAQMEGRLSYTSVLGEGTVFTLAFPAQ